MAGVDIRQMARRGGRPQAPRAANLAVSFEGFSHFVQQKYGLGVRSPILVGYSSGATLVYATLAQAPVGTFKGALSLGFCPDLEWRMPLCRGEGLDTTQERR